MTPSTSLQQLHQLSGSREPYSYWYATNLLEFRRLFGLQYRPCTPQERKAFGNWLMVKVDKLRRQ